VSNDAFDLKQRNLKAKYHDFIHSYQLGSWLFDAGCELLMHLQLPAISHEQCISLALIA
jgi:hypothetical protein